jgi:hypothetical protein
MILLAIYGVRFTVQGARKESTFFKSCTLYRAPWPYIMIILQLFFDDSQYIRPEGALQMIFRLS